MKIETNTKKENPVFTSVFYHAVATLTTPAGIMGVAIIAGNRHGNGGGLAFILESKLPVLITVFVLVASILNAGIYMVNRKKKLIISVDFKDEKEITGIEIKTLYATKIKEVLIPYSALNFYDKKENKIPLIPITDESLVLTKDQQYAGEFSLNGTFWNNEGGKMKLIREKLDQVKQKNILTGLKNIS